MANPFFKDLMPIVRVVPIDGDFTYMVRSSMNSANPAKRGRWGWPGGQIDLLPGSTGFAETDAYARIREFVQETGRQLLECTAPQLVETRKILDGKHAGKLAMTYACVAGRTRHVTDEIDPENDTAGWFPLETVAGMRDVTPITPVILEQLLDLRNLPVLVHLRTC